MVARVLIYLYMSLNEQKRISSGQTVEASDRLGRESHRINVLDVKLTDDLAKNFRVIGELNGLLMGFLATTRYVFTV